MRKLLPKAYGNSTRGSARERRWTHYIDPYLTHIYIDTRVRGGPGAHGCPPGASGQKAAAGKPRRARTFLNWRLPYPCWSAARTTTPRAALRTFGVPL